MEEIRGQDVRVILSLKQGRGFGHLSAAQIDGIFVEANLNGTVLDTDVIPINEKPIFDSELMWESDKKLLRRLRTGRTTIRVQCISVDDMHIKRDQIGQFILALRQAHVVPSGKSYTDIGESWSQWHRLSGGKSPYPELLCSLRVEEKPKMIQEAMKMKHNHPKQPVTRLLNPSLITQLHSDKGTVQISSDETATDNFILTVCVGQAVNLDLLLPGNYSVENAIENEKLCFHYSFLDYSINTAKMAVSNIYKPIPLNEKMMISLRSSLVNLQQYLSTSPKLIMKVMIGKDEIGVTEMPMQELVPTTNMDAFCSLNKDNTVTVESPCFIKGFKTGDVPTSPSGLQPYINLRIQLKYQKMNLKDNNQEEGQFEGLENEPARLIRSLSYTVLDAPTETLYKVPIIDIEETDTNDNAKIMGRGLRHNESVKTSGMIKQSTEENVHSGGHPQASEDVTEEVEDVAQGLQETETSGQSQLSAPTGQVGLPCSWIHNKNVQSECMMCDSSTQTSEETDELGHIYTLDITLQSVALQQCPSQRRCYFKFHHPHAEIISNSHSEITIKEPNKDIQLKDIKCKLRFVSTPGEINHLLLTCPPTISVCDIAEGQNIQLAVAMPNIGPVLVEKAKQCNCNTPLIDPRTMKEIGTLGIVLFLNDHGPKKANSKALLCTHTEQGLQYARFDDQIAFKVAEELEDWKERQQEIFRAKLKKQEQVHLLTLREEWKQRHMVMEKKFNRSVEQCQRLAQSLSDTTDELRAKISKNFDQEQELNQNKELLEQKYKLKVLEMKEAVKKIENDYSHQVVKLQQEKEDMDDKILKLEKEHALLKETVAAQEHELHEMKKSSLTKSQTKSLLQELKSMEEKLETALQSKSFFKEKWARAVQELNHIKNEYEKAIQIQIKHNQELWNLGLQNLMAMSEKEMKADQSVIQQLRTEMNTIQANSNVEEASPRYTKFFNPHKPPTTSLHSVESGKPSSHAQLNRPRSMQQKSHESQLKTLVEERDTLMNTGTYSLEDPVINKLDDKIKALLSNGIT